MRRMTTVVFEQNVMPCGAVLTTIVIGVVPVHAYEQSVWKTLRALLISMWRSMSDVEVRNVVSL